MATGEALALAIVIMVGLILLGRVTRTLGAVFLSLVLGDFLVWTMWAAMNNLRHGEELEDVTLPAELAVLSLSGWSHAGGARPPPPSPRPTGRPWPRPRPSSSRACYWASRSPTPRPPGPPGAVVALQACNAAYSTTSLAAPAGQVTVVLTNHDLFWHTFTIDQLHLDLEAPLGGTREASFTAPPGSYRSYCRVLAHAAAGMGGTLTIC